jgi:hypothetical protein
MESQLALPLLNDVDRDEEIISQLLNTTERRRRSHRCSYFNPTRKRCGAISFALLVWFGFMSTLWASSSCELVQIDYNKGGLELTIEGVGFWRYEQKVTNGTHISNYCAPYGQKVHKEINLEGFFPEDKTLQAYSIVSPSAAFASVLALMVCVVEVSVDPEILSWSMNLPGNTIDASVEPQTTIRSAMLAGVLLMMSGIFQMLATFSLLHYNPTPTATGYVSPLCNPTYSQCRLGPIGIWAVFGSLALFLAGVISCYFSCRTARRHGGKYFC